MIFVAVLKNFATTKQSSKRFSLSATIEGMKLKGRNKKLWWRVLLSVAVIVIVAGAVVAFLSNQSSKAPTKAPENQVQVAPPKSVALKTNTLFMGDVFWGRYINDWSIFF